VHEKKVPPAPPAPPTKPKDDAVKEQEDD